MARRILGILTALYLLMAVTTLALEQAGVTRCGCATTCWCKRPVLRTFRWVFPWGHIDAS